MTGPRVVVRTRGSSSHGWGHIVRMAVIEAELRRQFDGIAITMFAEVDGPAFEWLSGRVQDLVPLEEGIAVEVEALIAADHGPADLAIMDMLESHAGRQRLWRAKKGHLLLFDELCAHEHVADTVVCAQLLQSYPNVRSEAGTDTLLGVEWFVIAPEFATAALERNPPKAPARDLLVMLGGGVYADAELKIARALAPIASIFDSLSFVTGFSASDSHCRALAAQLPFATVLRGCSDVATLMASADLAVVSGGYSKYELACVGTPGLIFSVQEHQRAIAHAFAATGAAIDGGHIAGVETREIGNAVERLAADVRALRHSSECGRRLVDGRGLERVLARVLPQLRAFDLELATTAGGTRRG